MAYPKLALDVTQLCDVCDVLKKAGFKASDWESLTTRLKITDPGAIKLKYPNDPQLCLEETIRWWINSEEQSLEKLATEVSKVHGYGENTKRKILSLGAAHLKPTYLKPTQQRQPLRSLKYLPQLSIPLDTQVIKSDQEEGGYLLKHRDSGIGLVESPDGRTEVTFPVLSASDANSKGHKLRLRKEMRKMIMSFDNLVNRVLKSFQQRNVPIANIRITVKNLLRVPASSLPKRGSHDTWFAWLASHWSWFNTLLLEQLIEHNGSEEDKQQLREYHEKRRKFLQRRIYELPIESFGSERKGSEKLVVKMDEPYSTDKEARVLCEIHDLIYDEFEICAELLTVEDGCLKLTFQIPNSKLPPLTPEKKRIFKEKEISHIDVVSPAGTLSTYFDKNLTGPLSSVDPGFDSGIGSLEDQLDVMDTADASDASEDLIELKEDRKRRNEEDLPSPKRLHSDTSD